MNTKLIILDFDGVFCDLTQTKKKAILKLASKLKINFSDGILWEFINYIDQIYESKKIIKYEKIIHIVIKKLKERKILYVNSYDTKEFCKNFESELNKNFVINAELVRFLKLLKTKNPTLKICVYSNQEKNIIKDKLQTGKIESAFVDRIYGRDDFSELKPSMKNLKTICEDFEVKPFETLMIGDNIVIDLVPAYFLGMRTVLYTRSVNYLVRSTKDMESVFK